MMKNNVRFLSTSDWSNDEVESLPHLWGGSAERRRCAASSGSGGRGGRDERSSLSGAPSTASAVAFPHPNGPKEEILQAPPPPRGGEKSRGSRSFSSMVALLGG